MSITRSKRLLSSPPRLFHVPQGTQAAREYLLEVIPTLPRISLRIAPIMLRRKPTAITLTSEDVAAFEDARIAKAQGAAAENARKSKEAQAADLDPNDELRPLPGDKGKASKTAQIRDERIGVSH
ncbi:MAG: hypothetical protein L6R36_001896 [Xanthoria steineri]|nr:MAG: hypothetical protein L6R36_001896 [Xanthoria steineri]